MRKYLGIAGAALAFAVSVAAATVASATTFVGGYGVTHHTSGNGLLIETDDITPGAGNGFTFNLVNKNDTAYVNLFNIYTFEEDAGLDDFIGKPISVSFNFSLPENFGGSVGGTTGAGAFVNFLGFYNEFGRVTWNNNGNTLLNFGDGGQLLVHLDDAIFNQGATAWFRDRGLNPGTAGQATITAKFTLKNPATITPPPAGAVPEPATWAMMLLGFFGLGSAVRSQRRRGFGLSAVSAA